MIKEMITFFAELMGVVFAFFCALFLTVVGVVMVGGSVISFFWGDVFSPKAPYFQKQIEQCFAKGGDVHLDPSGYLRECRIKGTKQ